MHYVPAAGEHGTFFLQLYATGSILGALIRVNVPLMTPIFYDYTTMSKRKILEKNYCSTFTAILVHTFNHMFTVVQSGAKLAPFHWGGVVEICPAKFFDALRICYNF